MPAMAVQPIASEPAIALLTLQDERSTDTLASWTIRRLPTPMPSQQTSRTHRISPATGRRGPERLRGARNPDLGLSHAVREDPYCGDSVCAAWLSYHTR